MKIEDPTMWKDLAALIKSFDSTGSGPPAEAASKLTALLGNLMPSGDYSKQAAISDAQRIFDSIFRTYRERELPQIYKAQASSGGYNSTAAQLLANDAYARAVEAAGKAVLENVKNYADIETERAKAAGSVGSALRGAQPQPLKSPNFWAAAVGAVPTIYKLLYGEGGTRAAKKAAETAMAAAAAPEVLDVAKTFPYIDTPLPAPIDITKAVADFSAPTIDNMLFQVAADIPPETFSMLDAASFIPDIGGIVTDAISGIGDVLSEAFSWF